MEDITEEVEQVSTHLLSNGKEGNVRTVDLVNMQIHFPAILSLRISMVYWMIVQANRWHLYHEVVFTAVYLMDQMLARKVMASLEELETLCKCCVLLGRKYHMDISYLNSFFEFQDGPFVSAVKRLHVQPTLVETYQRMELEILQTVKCNLYHRTLFMVMRDYIEEEDVLRHHRAWTECEMTHFLEVALMDYRILDIDSPQLLLQCAAQLLNGQRCGATVAPRYPWMVGLSHQIPDCFPGYHKKYPKPNPSVFEYLREEWSELYTSSTMMSPTSRTPSPVPIFSFSDGTVQPMSAEIS
jgi:hypothetical protein